MSCKRSTEHFIQDNESKKSRNPLKGSTPNFAYNVICANFSKLIDLNPPANHRFSDDSGREQKLINSLKFA